MALLSATQGTPERVWSLLTILAAHDASMERQVLTSWLNPRFIEGGQVAKEEKTAVDQTIQAAHGLRLVDSSQRNQVRLLVGDVPEDQNAFADLVHEKLIALPADEADAVLLEAFAWQVIQVELVGSTRWIDDWTNEQFADQANAALSPPGWTGERRFNSTKRAPWRRWMEFLSLSTSLPSGHNYPYVTSRVERELHRGDLPVGQEVPAEEFMKMVANRLPYLDGGRIFSEYAARLSYSSAPRSVSRVLSTALRDLQEDGVITLVLHGDSSDNYTLASDAFSRTRSFGTVVIHGASNNG